MKYPVSSGQIGLSVIYAIVILPIAYLIGIAIDWAANTYLFNVLDWFNRLKPIWRFFLLLAGGGALITLTGGVINMIFGIAVLSFFRKLEANMFVVIWSAIVYGAAMLFSIISLIKFWPGWNFWLTIEFILMAVLIIFAYYPLISLALKRKEYE